MPPEVIKVAIEGCPEFFVKIFNNIIRSRNISDLWKEARLVLLPKELKPGQELETYRPLCMLNALSKPFENLLIDKLTQTIKRLVISINISTVLERSAPL